VTDWVVLLPLKRLTRAKSRLALPRPSHRPDVVRRMAEAVATAACRAAGVGTVVVVTDEDWDQAAAPALVVREPAEPGLNAALSHAAAVVGRRWPDRPVAALPSDVAAMTAPELGACLAAASHHRRAVVADHGGTGTVLLTATPGVRLDPRFGPDSRQAHVLSGAVDLTRQVDAPLIRMDIDTTHDLLALHRRVRHLPGLEAALRRAGWDGTTTGSATTSRGPADSAAPSTVTLGAHP
jgi:2-phospho-L-lactate guanylyltransferase